MTKNSTIFIYDQCMEEPIQFFILDGNYSNMNRIYINAHYEDKSKVKLQDKLTTILYGKNGTLPLQVTLLSDFPVEYLSTEGYAGNKVHIVTVGFLL